MLILTRKPNTKVLIGDDITVVVLGVSGQYVRLGFKVPKHIPIWREEVAARIALEGNLRPQPGAA